MGSFTDQDQDQDVSLLICEVLESASNVATGESENGGLGATSCHPGCPVFPGNGFENSYRKMLAADEDKETDGKNGTWGAKACKRAMLCLLGFSLRVCEYQKTKLAVCVFKGGHLPRRAVRVTKT